jgi:cupin 2 domain-containing protein
MRSGNIFANVPETLGDEQFITLLSSPHVRIERIVSMRHASPPDFWFDQDWTEWVVVLAGSAGLRIAGEDATLTLRPGDYVELPAHAKHRIEWTDADQPTVWLAVHLEAQAGS